MKRLITTTAQVLVTVGLLYLLFRDPARRASMWSTLQGADKRWFVAGFGAYVMVALLGSLRWQIIMRVQNIRLSFTRVLQLFMIGAFFNLFMLGTVGGDVVKVFYVWKETAQQKAAALLTVFVDRLIGLIALIVLSVLIIGLRYEVFPQSTGTRALMFTMTVVLAGAAALLLVSFAITGFGLVNRLPAGMPARALIIELSLAYNAYGHAWRTSLVAFLLSIAAHLSSFLSFYFAARAFTDALSPGEVLTVMPIVNTVTALPVSLSGVGVREFAFDTLLGDLYGITPDVASLISLMGFTIIAFGGALGGIVYLFYRSSHGGALSPSAGD